MTRRDRREGDVLWIFSQFPADQFSMPRTSRIDATGALHHIIARRS